MVVSAHRFGEKSNNIGGIMFKKSDKITILLIGVLSVVFLFLSLNYSFSPFFKSEAKAKFQRAKGKDDGWISLFNGKDLTGWDVPKRGNWRVENGEMVVTWDEANPGGGWIVTKEIFDDFILRMKFKVNKGGNSGVCIRDPSRATKNPAYSGYEVQIDFNDLTNPTGSLYNLARAYTIIGAYTPEERIVGKEEEWNQFEISAIGEHIVVKLNGEKVVERYDRRSLKGVVGMQLHDRESVVRFRDIEIMPISMRGPIPPPIEERLKNAKGDFKKLFNGENLAGWQVLWGGDWKVVDGVIEGTIKGSMGWLVTKEEYSDFIYRLKVKIAKGGNSGLTTRFPFPTRPEDKTYKAGMKDDKLNPAFGGYEIQILAYDLPQIGNPSGSIYNIGRAYAGVLKPNEWNEYVVYAQGPQTTVYINGRKVAEAEDTRSLKGVVGLQVHHLEEELVGVETEPYKVWFKDIEIKAVK